MQQKEKTQKNWAQKVGNVVFVGVLLFILFNGAAKAWVLQQLAQTGLFNATIKTEPPSNATDAIAFNYLDENNKTLSTTDLKGKVVFINFWATWCPPCRAEMPSINNLYKEFSKDERFVFLFINEDEDAAKVTDYLNEKGYKLPVTKAVGPIPKEVYSGTLPTTLVLNKEGKVVMKKEGLGNYDSKKFIAQLKSLL